MAIFGNKKEKVEKKDVKSEAKDVSKETKATEKKASIKVKANVDLSWVILRPRITEKGAVISETSNAYTFDVHKDATKTLVKEAIKEMYNVEPVKVNVVVMARKKIERQRGRARKVGLKGGGKKAFVFLKKGDQIQFV